MPAKRPRGKPREGREVLSHQIAVRLTDQEHAAFCQLAAGSCYRTPARLARELIRAHLANSAPPTSRPPRPPS